jgi:pre-rRNA-processing protein TSR4
MAGASSVSNRAELQASIPESASSSSLSSSSEEEDKNYHAIVLGFAEHVRSPASFDPKRFPSKLGGLPVWLYGRHRIPSSLRCRCCNGVLAFLLQLYAPIAEQGHAFHRTVYVFVCRERGCAGGAGSVRALCAQLPRRNRIYSYDAESDSSDCEDHCRAVEVGKRTSDAVTKQHVPCALCGFAASSRCGRCSSVSYCSRECQKVDWKIGHKSLCYASDGMPSREVPSTSNANIARVSWRFEEFEIVHEQCLPLRESDTADQGLTGAVSGKAGVVGTLQDVDVKELPDSLFKNIHRAGPARRADPAFQRFSDVMRGAPDQIVRYWRGGRPLWASRIGRVAESDEALICERCGGRRVFEFQVVSQVLYYIGVDKRRDLRSDDGGCGGLDWATVVVFSCENSCRGNGASEDEARGEALEYCYTEELAVIQRFT